jgi:glycosyltransferase involved in cell wall biosynthesis
VLLSSEVKTVFSTNPLFQRSWAERDVPGGHKLTFVPEVGALWANAPTKSAARAALGIPTDRHLILCYGSLDSRKNISHLLAILQRDVSQRLAALIVGQLSKEYELLLSGPDSMALKEKSRLFIHPGYASNRLEANSFAAADAAWVAYKGYAGPSGVMELAGAAGLPAIGSTIGVIGHLVAAEKLGLCIEGFSADDDYVRVLEFLTNSSAMSAASERSRERVCNHGASFGRAICETISRIASPRSQIDSLLAS